MSSCRGLVWLIALGCGVAGCREDTDEELVRRALGPEGGQVSSHDGALTLHFLPGVLREDVTISIEPSDVPPRSFGRAYRVRPDIDLEEDVLVTYRGTLPFDASGARVGVIRRADYEAGRGRWRALPLNDLSVEGGFVSGLDQELSLFYTLLDDGPSDVAGDTTGSTDSTADPTTSLPSGGTASDFSETIDLTLPTGPTEMLTHDDDIAAIWAETCMGAACHSAGSPYPPDLESDAYTTLLDGWPVAASLPYVEPGSAEESYLWWKLTDPEACDCNGGGAPMPRMGNLAAEDLARVRTWIEQGAVE